jgi:hypothetical protein
MTLCSEDYLLERFQGALPQRTSRFVGLCNGCRDGSVRSWDTRVRYRVSLTNGRLERFSGSRQGNRLCHRRAAPVVTGVAILSLATASMHYGHRRRVASSRVDRSRQRTDRSRRRPNRFARGGLRARSSCDQPGIRVTVWHRSVDERHPVADKVSVDSRPDGLSRRCHSSDRRLT